MNTISHQISIARVLVWTGLLLKIIYLFALKEMPIVEWIGLLLICGGILLFVLKGNSAELEKFKYIALIAIPSLVIIGIYIYIVIR